MIQIVLKQNKDKDKDKKGAEGELVLSKTK